MRSSVISLRSAQCFSWPAQAACRHHLLWKDGDEAHARHHRHDSHPHHSVRVAQTEVDEPVEIFLHEVEKEGNQFSARFPQHQFLWQICQGPFGMQSAGIQAPDARISVCRWRDPADSTAYGGKISCNMIVFIVFVLIL